MQDLTNIKPGDIISLGKWPYDENGHHALIEWIVLEVKDSMFLLISRYCLDSLPFDSITEKGNWEDSKIRAWLNEDFYNNAFDEKEKAAIIGTEVENYTIFFSFHLPTKKTIDHVFMLNADEAEKYFKKEADRITKPTPYAFKQLEKLDNVRPETKDACMWWLRNLGGSVEYSAYVSPKGFVRRSGTKSSNHFGMIRPAIILKTK